MSARNAAHSAVSTAVQSGRIPPARTLVCVDCGGRARDYDHRDYSQPLSVEPVCRSCNLLRGPAINADRGAFERTAFGRWIDAQPRGAASALSLALNVPRPLMTQWGKGIRQIPLDKAVGIERETAGSVTCEEMRPDAAWVRVKDRKWPHTKGRPLVNLEPAKATA